MVLKRRLVFTGERRGEQHLGGSEGHGTSEKLNCGLGAVRLGLVPGEPPPWEGPPPWERPSFRAVLLGGAESGLCVRIALVLGCGLSQSRSVVPDWQLPPQGQCLTRL